MQAEVVQSLSKIYWKQFIKEYIPYTIKKRMQVQEKVKLNNIIFLQKINSP